MEGIGPISPQTLGYAQLVGDDGQLLLGLDQSPSFAYAWGPATVYTMRTGRTPTQEDEVVIDAHLAETSGATVGELVQVATRGGVEQFRLVGVAQSGEQPGSSAALFFTPATVARRAGTTEPLALLIAGDGSTSPDALAPRIAAAIGDAEVRSGAAAVADDLEQARMGVQDLTRVLTLFAVIGVGLGGVVAVNAFALTLAQRRREHALLRTLGASPRQLLALAGGEALLVALLGGLGGWGLGFAVAGAMQRAFAETTGGFSSDALGTVAVRASLPALAATLLCGSLAALGAVAVPAWRAARVAPLASLRDAGIEQGARSRQRSWLALAAFALMVGAALLQRLAAGGAPPAASLVGLLVGVATLTLAAPGLLAAAAPLAGRLGLLLAPRVGDLARASVARNPRRVR